MFSSAKSIDGLVGAMLIWLGDYKYVYYMFIYYNKRYGIVIMDMSVCWYI
jgi:hypothetical protein